MPRSHELNESSASRLAAGLWAVLGAGVCALMGRLEPSLLEEGLIVHVADRLLHGERLYVDVASFTGPLPFELLALLFRLFGDEIAVARAAVAIATGAGCASAFALARRAGAGAIAHLVAAVIASGPVLLFPLHSIYFYSTLAYHLVLVAAYAAVRAQQSTGWGVAAGVLVAAVALCKQSLGASFAVALLLAIVASAPRGARARAGLATAAGGMAIAIGVVLVYALRGELGAVIDSLVVVPLGFEAAFASPLPNLWPLGVLDAEIRGYAHFYTPFIYSMLRGVVVKAASPLMIAVTQLAYALPFLALAATAIRRLGGGFPPAVWIHAAAVFAGVTSLFPRSDWGHLTFVLLPAVAQLLLLAPRRRPGRSPGRLGVAALLVAALAAGDVYVARGLWRLAEPARLGPKVQQLAVTEAMRSSALSRVLGYLREHAAPGEPIFVPRSEPLIYFASNTSNPTPYSGVIPGQLEQQEEVILAALEDVRFVVMSEIDQPVFTYYRNLLPGVQAYLERHFRVAPPFLGRGYQWIVVLERAEPRAATQIDLWERRDRAQRWVRDRLGRVIPDSRPTPELATNQNRRPLPVRLGPGGGGIDFDIEVPANARFEADVGLAKIRGSRLRHPLRAIFSVTVLRGGTSDRLTSAPVAIRSDVGTNWQPISVDLAAYAGQRIVLRLGVVAPGHGGRNVAWWGSPRIAAAPTTSSWQGMSRTLATAGR